MVVGVIGVPFKNHWIGGGAATPNTPIQICKRSPAVWCAVIAGTGRGYSLMSMSIPPLLSTDGLRVQEMARNDDRLGYGRIRVNHLIEKILAVQESIDAKSRRQGWM
jgi:hypothetical protein